MRLYKCATRGPDPWDDFVEPSKTAPGHTPKPKSEGKVGSDLNKFRGQKYEARYGMLKPSRAKPFIRYCHNDECPQGAVDTRAESIKSKRWRNGLGTSR